MPPDDEPFADETAASMLLALMLAAHGVVGGALEAAMKAECGINSSHFSVLMALAEATGGQLRMVDIAARNCISRSGVTQSVDRLERLGLVVRSTSPEDRRLVLATITEAGTALLPVGYRVFKAVAEQCIGQRLGPRQVVTLRSALMAITAGSAHGDAASRVRPRSVTT